MGTRATIRFTEDDHIIFVYRGHDGFPDNIIPDIKAAIDKAKGRWSAGGELGTFVTLFLAMHFDVEKRRLPDYELTQSFHGDESYRYYCNWNGDKCEYGILNNE